MTSNSRPRKGASANNEAEATTPTASTTPSKGSTPAVPAAKPKATRKTATPPTAVAADSKAPVEKKGPAARKAPGAPKTAASASTATKPAATKKAPPKSSSAARTPGASKTATPSPKATSSRSKPAPPPETVPAAAAAAPPKPSRSRRSRAAAAGAAAAGVGTAALASSATEAAPAVAPSGSNTETSVLAPEAEAPAADAVDERVRLLSETPSVEPEAGYLEPEQPYYYDHAAPPAEAAALPDQPEVSALEPEPPAYGSGVEETAPAQGGEEAASGAAAAAIGTSTGAVVGAAAVDPASLTEAGQATAAPSTKFERRLERMRTDPTSGVADATAIGTETALFDCPTCSRPLPVGTSRCPQCGTRLIGRRTARRVGTMATAALVAVVAVAVGITAVLAMSGGPSGIATVPSSAPSASGGTGTATPSIALTPAPATPGIPAGAAVALSGTTLVNTRITQDGRALAAVLADKNARTIDVARAIRVIAADAQQGLDMSGRLAPWTEAATVAAQLDAFYRNLADTARDALRASLTDDGTYRRAGARIVTEIRKVDEVDAASRTLATSVGLQLPALGDPGSVISPPPS